MLRRDKVQFARHLFSVVVFVVLFGRKLQLKRRLQQKKTEECEVIVGYLHNIFVVRLPLADVEAVVDRRRNCSTLDRFYWSRMQIDRLLVGVRVFAATFGSDGHASFLGQAIDSCKL